MKNIFVSSYLKVETYFHQLNDSYLHFSQMFPIICIVLQLPENNYHIAPEGVFFWVPRDSCGSHT